MNRAFKSRAIVGIAAAVCLLLSASIRGENNTSAGKASASSAGKLTGVWVSESDYGPRVRGELTMEARGGTWRAEIAGFTIAVQRDKDALQFALPDGQGEFRGRFSSGRKEIHGHWIQAAGTINNVRYASPVELTALGSSVWRGNVAPLEDRISLYVCVQEAADGSQTAFISNPEKNFFRGRKYKVERKGSTVEFSMKGQQFGGTYDEKSDSLTLQVVDFMPPFTFRRGNGAGVAGFQPRVPQESGGYVYREPIAENDGWATGSLQEAEMDSQLISALMEKILGANPAANPADNRVDIHSLLIARHGKLVLEEYFYGFDKERTHDMRSASKTFAPMLAGMAREHGAKFGPETPVYGLFPQYKSFANWDERKKRMTLGEVMTMTAGNACDDNDDNSPGNEDRMQNQNEQPDWYKYTLDLPMAREPGGEHAIYCSGDLNLVGGVVATSTGKWIPEIFDEYFARPLQIRSYHLNLMPTGEAYMGGGAYLRPRDELKLGQLYLNGGTWNGRRVVSKEWVAESTKHHSSFTPFFTMEGDHEYGYGWHIHHLKSGGKVYREYAAEGNGGQSVIVIPELDLVIGLNGGSYGEASKWYGWELELVPQYIIPAATAKQER